MHLKTSLKSFQKDLISFELIKANFFKSFSYDLFLKALYKFRQTLKLIVVFNIEVYDKIKTARKLSAHARA